VPNRRSNARTPDATLREYAAADAVALAALIDCGDTTPAELADLARRAYERVNPRINAVVELYEELPEQPHPRDGSHSHSGVTAAAPLGGVPFLRKDYGSPEAGRRQECGSRLLEGRVSAHDGELMARFRRAGLQILGRTATPEFALSLSTASIAQGATHNPWRPDLLAGGSSGGSAASVAAGVVPIAHATDAAGSIRIPASACGIVGLKPSRGRVSHAPAPPAPVLGMDVEFAGCRTVRDAAILLDLVAGAAPGDPSPAAPPVRPYRTDLGAPVGGLRVGWTTRPWGGYRVDTEVAGATEEVARLLEELGLVVEEDTPSFDYEAFVGAAGIGWALGFDRLLEGHAAEMGRPLDGSTLEPVTLALYEQARRLRGRDVAWAEEALNGVRREVGRFFTRYDLLLTPTLLRPPEPLGVYSQSAPFADFDAFFRACDQAGAFLPLFNATGQPALSLPLAFSTAGMPLGMQLVAPVGREDLLLRLGYVLEEARPWRHRRPAIHAAASE
jgi:amidase